MVKKSEDMTTLQIFTGTEHMALAHSTLQWDVYMRDAPDKDSTKTPKDKPYVVVLALVAIVKPSALRDQLSGTEASFSPEALTMLNFLNISVRMAALQMYPHNARSFFVEQGKVEIGGGFELWRGYFQSVRPTIDFLLLNVDITAAVMFKPGPLINVCCEILGWKRDQSNVQDLATLTLQQRHLLRRRLIKLPIAFQIGSKQTRVTRRITDIIFAPPNEHAFVHTPSEEEVTVEQYFQRYHNFKLQYPQLFCVRFDEKHDYPIEVYVVPKGQIYGRPLPTQSMKPLLDFAAVRPEKRFDLIQDAFEGRSDIFRHQESDYFKQTGMKIKPHLIKTSGRLLPAPMLLFGNGKSLVPNENGWNFRDDKTFYTPKRLAVWSVLVLDPATSKYRVVNFIEGLVRTLTKRGMDVPTPQPEIITRPPQGNMDQLIGEAGGRAITQWNQQSRGQGKAKSPRSYLGGTPRGN